MNSLDVLSHADDNKATARTIIAACCGRGASGHVAAAQSSVMNAIIRSPRRRERAASADARQAAALFLIAPMIAVSMAPPAPPAIACEMIPSTLRLPDCAAAVIAGSNR